ncbi:MAG: hypothetical protein ACQESR_04690 [Planctomycetota bacterium]
MQKVEVLRAACCVAGADGETTTEERKILKHLADDVGVGEVSLGAMIERAETDKEFEKEQFQVLKADPHVTMQVLFRIAVTDAKLHGDELTVLKKLARRLEVTTEQFKQWYEEAVNEFRQNQAGTES